MKNFKEKILMLGKKRYCFISLLLAFLLGFSVLTALNGSKSGKTEVNALSSPAYKNLDLNGERFTYQTSLNELKNNYNIFRNGFNNYYFGFEENSEGVVSLYYSAFTNITDDNNKLTRQDAFNKIFLFYDNNNNIVDNNFIFTTNDNFDNDNISLNTNVTALKVNFSEFINYFILAQEYINKDIIIQFIYLKDNFPQSEESNLDYIRNNSIIYSYYLGSQIDYTLNIPKFDGYNLTNIGCWAGDTLSNDNMISCESFSTVRNNSLSRNTSGQILIDELKFIENNKTNVLTFKTIFIDDDSKPYFKGNILLSETKYDEDLFGKLNSLPDIYSQPIGRGYFGGYNAEKTPVGNIYYSSIAAPGLGGVGGFDNYPQSPINYRNYSLFFGFINPLDGDSVWTYRNQNQLLYLQDLTNLRINSSEYSGAGLSAQVENILYNVNYVGNIEEIEFDKRVQEDFVQLAKTTGLGALIGLILGFIFGNPLGGLGIGGGIGAVIGILPLIIDGIDKAIGGTILGPLIDILYGIFDAIAKIFASIVDILFELLLSLITNPLILILVAIFVLLYVFYFRKK